MGKILLRIITYAIAIDLTAQLLPGIHLANNDLSTLLIIGLLFGVVNAFIKPIIMVLTCPFVLLTLGLFVLVINGLLLLLTAQLSGNRLTIDNFGWAFLGGIIMGIISVILEAALGSLERKQPAKSEP
jgi:putative membrane protein